MTVKDKVKKKFPHFYAEKPQTKWRVWDPYGDREGPSIEGEGNTEAEAWKDAANNLGVSI